MHVTDSYASNLIQFVRQSLDKISTSKFQKLGKTKYRPIYVKQSGTSTVCVLHQSNSKKNSRILQ